MTVTSSSSSYIMVCFLFIYFFVFRAVFSRILGVFRGVLGGFRYDLGGFLATPTRRGWVRGGEVGVVGR